MPSAAARAVTAYLTGEIPEAYESVIEPAAQPELDDATLKVLAKKAGLDKDMELSSLRELVLALMSAKKGGPSKQH